MTGLFVLCLTLVAVGAMFATVRGLTITDRDRPGLYLSWTFLAAGVVVLPVAVCSRQASQPTEDARAIAGCVRIEFAVDQSTGAHRWRCPDRPDAVLTPERSEAAQALLRELAGLDATRGP